MVLSENGEAKQWFLKTGENEYTPMPGANQAEIAKAVNDYIFDRINHVRVWEGGQTYYFFDVKHLGAGNSVGEYGIVRNHIYRTTVNSIEGLGTPVYDPDQVIIPEQNEYDESIVTADIKILQWRVVESSYDIKWK